MGAARRRQRTRRAGIVPLSRGKGLLRGERLTPWGNRLLGGKRPAQEGSGYSRGTRLPPEVISRAARASTAGYSQVATLLRHLRRPWMRLAMHTGGMRITALVLQMTIRLLFVVQLIVGLLFWTGNAFAFVPVHMLLGLLLVLCLWLVAVLAWRAGAPLGLAGAAVVWGLLTAWLGLNQVELLPGDLHWLIRVLHLLVGMGAVGLAESLGVRIKERIASPAAA